MDKSKQAFPQALQYDAAGRVAAESVPGMTLREYAAVAAIQGITMEEYTRFGMDSCVNFAMLKTDALIARLEKGL